MNSPFPGMDPYLEDPAFWADFHLTFIGCWREAVAAVLPEPYEARLDETIHFVHMSEAVSRGKRPARRTSRRAGGTAVLKPTIIPHRPLQRVRQSRIEILHRPERSLVTVLEMLSPANETGDGYAEYCSKRQAILQQKTHLVELDLLLSGRRLPLARPLPAGDYCALVSRAEDRPKCEVYSWFLRQPLPPLPIPLLTPDPDVIIELQSVFRKAFKRGRYARSLSYGQPPPIALPEHDAHWVIEQE